MIMCFFFIVVDVISCLVYVYKLFDGWGDFGSYILNRLIYFSGVKKVN